MEKVSIDIFANTNPAFCSLILHSFCQGYYTVKGKGVTFPLLLLPIPIILSNDLAPSFDGTNVKTGFLSWVKKNPFLTIGLSDRIESAYNIIKPGIAFACSKSILEVNSKGEFFPKDDALKNYVNVVELSKLYKNAYRLGQWLGEINSTKTIYNHLGISL